MRYRHRRRARAYVACGAAIALVAACTGGSDTPDTSTTAVRAPQTTPATAPPTRPAQPDVTATPSGTQSPRPPTPKNLQASPSQGRVGAPLLRLRFDAVDDAAAYVVRLGPDAAPIRVSSSQCHHQNCAVLLSRLTVAGAETVTVSAVRRGSTSAPSAPVDLPSLSRSKPEGTASPKTAPPETAPPETGPPTTGPVTLVVTRSGKDGRPVVQTVTVPEGENLKARIAHLRDSKDVLGVGLDVPVELTSAPDRYQVPRGSGTWQREALDFDILPRSRGKGVTIAVIDAYVDPDHPTFDFTHIETTLSDPDVERDDRLTHATGVASLIVGGAENKIPGIATSATVHNYDAINQGGWPTIRPIAEAIIAAVDDGADIINMSLSFHCEWTSYLGGGCPEDALGPAIEYAETEGVVVVASAGNDGDKRCTDGDPVNQDAWPAKFRTVIAVGATVRSGKKFDCSAEKPYVDVLAPGAGLLVATPPDEYMIASGTSYSAPLVSGLLADILAERPKLSPQEIRTMLRRSVMPNKRLVTAALLLNADLYPEDRPPPIDPSTARSILAFEASMQFPEGSAVWNSAAAAWKHAPPYKTRMSWSPITTRSFPVTVEGTLFIDEHGNIRGFGSLEHFAGYAFSRHPHGLDVGHYIQCPVGPHPLYVFTFARGVYVEGKAHTNPQAPKARSADLTLSFGRGATAQHSGRVGHVIVKENGIDECAAQYDEIDSAFGFSEPDPPWEEVRTWPEQNVRMFRKMYVTLYRATPIHLHNAFFPPSSGPGKRDYVGGGTTGAVMWQLRVGDINNR